ncbi:reverse transcriptase domain, Reverse transcriptase zinc-binding domain protein [Artemisia annua]|uniref:Reverse transcriptase domain, Reverse transcriptase zinc-binding domain protein n=1 Tax=Artemisia annua TaxID=35608 RepID=A0A2U1P1X0_ARTAN|nr:reverse transcriptase domain, Reverse transcriptase zinc-binding domain protein [Artemisia annua]
MVRYGSAGIGESAVIAFRGSSNVGFRQARETLLGSWRPYYELTLLGVLFGFVVPRLQLTWAEALAPCFCSLWFSSIILWNSISLAEISCFIASTNGFNYINREDLGQKKSILDLVNYFWFIYLFSYTVCSTGGFIALSRYASANHMPPSILSRDIGWQWKANKPWYIQKNASREPIARFRNRICLDLKLIIQKIIFFMKRSRVCLDLKQSDEDSFGEDAYPKFNILVARWPILFGTWSRHGGVSPITHLTCFWNPPHSGLHTSPWQQIVKLENDLFSYGISLPSVFKKKIGNDCNTLFWLDTWIGNEPLKDSLPRLFRLESNPSALMCLPLHFIYICELNELIFHHSE